MKRTNEEVQAEIGRLGVMVETASLPLARRVQAHAERLALMWFESNLVAIPRAPSNRPEPLTAKGLGLVEDEADGERELHEARCREASARQDLDELRAQFVAARQEWNEALRRVAGQSEGGAIVLEAERDEARERCGKALAELQLELEAQRLHGERLAAKVLEAVTRAQIAEAANGGFRLELDRLKERHARELAECRAGDDRWTAARALRERLAKNHALLEVARDERDLAFHQRDNLREIAESYRVEMEQLRYRIAGLSRRVRVLESRDRIRTKIASFRERQGEATQDGASKTTGASSEPPCESCVHGGADVHEGGCACTEAPRRSGATCLDYETAGADPGAQP